MTELHERLSEFSYGYGVTRDVERLLVGVGVRTVPFMPSLLDEKKIGFDVGFNGRGVPLLIQFKLGQALTRFVRSNKKSPAPTLTRPFFRFSVDTAEPAGQFETLIKAETDGAEVYYVAPLFADWPHYVNLFAEGGVISHSIIVTPRSIHDALIAKNSPAGHHRIIYDRSNVHVCSEPSTVPPVLPEMLAERVANRVQSRGATLGETIRRVYNGLERQESVRRGQSRGRQGPEIEGVVGFLSVPEPELERRLQTALTRTQRTSRLAQIRERSESEQDAIAAALGFELWGNGHSAFTCG